MGKIVYSFIANNDENSFFNFRRKICHDIYFSSQINDVCFFALDEETKTFVAAMYSVIDKGFSLRYCSIEEYEDDINVYGNLLKLALNYSKEKNRNLDIFCERTKQYNELKKFGFWSTDMREEAALRNIEGNKKLIEEYKQELESAKNPSVRNNIQRNIRFYTENLEIFRCPLKLKSEDIESYLTVDGYVELDKIEPDCLYAKEESDPKIFKEDDKYLYCEVNKTDKEYSYFFAKIASEITVPNLMVNGGTLMGIYGLEYPEKLVYIKNKENNEIVGYVGITEHYGIGLYITQIAVKEKYKHIGVGTIMLDEAIRRANKKNIDTVSAEIRDDNFKSIGLFSKLGFEKNDPKFYCLNVAEYIDSHSKEENARIV